MTVTHYWTSPGAPLRRGGLDGYEMAFVHQKASEGYPASAIAKMLARNVEGVQAMMPEVAVTRRAPATATPAPETPTPPVPKPTLHGRLIPVVRQIAKESGFSVEDLVGFDRKRPLAWARQRAYYECYQIMREDGTRYFSTLRIGAIFGDRDHTTIYHGIKAHAARLEAAGASL